MPHTPTDAGEGQSVAAPLTHEGHEILFPKLPYRMGARAAGTLGDAQLQAAIEKATFTKSQQRQSSFVETFGQDNYDAMRELSGQIRQHTLDHLDHYLGQWIDRAEAAGVKVHFAKDGDEANRICLDIAKERQCKLCVKSKSMVTEETRLLPALEKIGCETVETDLGEFILQLDHDAPSHIVTPMIHKDRFAVARAFQREINAPYTEDPAELTQIARKYLREKYRRADLGISGGNFLVAETGSLVLCTNEGNGRFCTTAPRTHVAFVGIEKVIPRLEHLGVLLKMLARSSTGQPLTCYTHIMTGPRRENESDGPQDMHVILVDNGRTKLLGENTRQMLRCIRCGACLNACPVYRKVGGHAYGSVYSGPIGALITPMLRGLDQYKDLPHASSLCGACGEACPVKIDIPGQLIELRRQMVERRIAPLPERLIMRSWTWAYRFAPTYRLTVWAQRIGFRLWSAVAGTRPRKGDRYNNQGWVRWLPPPVGGWTDQRDMPTPSSHGFRDWWRQRDSKEGAAK